MVALPVPFKPAALDILRVPFFCRAKWRVGAVSASHTGPTAIMESASPFPSGSEQ